MILTRRLAFLLMVLGPLAAGCAGHTVKNGPAGDPSGSGRDLFVLLPDPDTAAVGRATVSNGSGKADLAAARAATYVSRNQAPSAVTTLSESEVRDAIGGALAALPQAPQHFTLNFIFGSDELTPESRASVPDILRAVNGREFPDVLVLGHTDTAGPAPTNAMLGLRRAVLVRQILIDNGLNASLIDVDSHGESDLLVPTADGVSEPRNRRVEITVR
jgi:OOP family OmpA-OmpF porin